MNREQQIIEYIGITLTLFSLLTVVGVYIIRIKGLTNENTVKSWGYPVTPLLFIVLMLWMISFFVYSKPVILLWSIGSMLPGVIIYYLTRQNDLSDPYLARQKNRQESNDDVIDQDFESK